MKSREIILQSEFKLAPRAKTGVFVNLVFFLICVAIYLVPIFEKWKLLPLVIGIPFLFCSAMWTVLLKLDRSSELIIFEDSISYRSTFRQRCFCLKEVNCVKVCENNDGGYQMKIVLLDGSVVVLDPRFVHADSFALVAAVRELSTKFDFELELDSAALPERMAG